MENLKRRLIIIPLLWWLVGLLLATFRPDINEVLWIGAGLVQLMFLALGLALLGWAGASMRSRRNEATISAILTLTGLAGNFTFTPVIGEQIRFAFLRAGYEQRVGEILALQKPNSPAKLRDCEIDPGPPVRIAFPWQRGVTDNWVGLVYDPSGGVMDANAFKRDWSNWNDPRLGKVKRLFGGDLYRARRLRGNWYLCWFT